MLRRPRLLQQLVGALRQASMACEPTPQQLAERLASSGQACSSSSLAAPPPRPPREPWTPTQSLEKRKDYRKRMRHLITVLEKEHVDRVSAARPLPDFWAGDVLEVQVVVPEAGRGVYTYRGVCLARGNKGPRSWFKLYNVFPDAGGFVQHFPIFMPDLVGVKVVGRLPRARRARQYHLLRDESGAHTYQAEVAPPK